MSGCKIPLKVNIDECQVESDGNISITFEQLKGLYEQQRAKEAIKLENDQYCDGGLLDNKPINISGSPLTILGFSFENKND